MTAATWIIEDLGRPALGSGGALVWVLAAAGPAAERALGEVRPTRADLADAARAREEGGWGRLRRRLLLRVLAARALALAPDLVRIERDAGGRPVFPDLDLHAAVSGASGHAALALATRPIGVDIEATSAADADDPDLRLWTAREAYAKALGVGWTIEPASIRLTARGPGFAASAPRREPAQGEWMAGAGFIAAAARLEQIDG